MEKKNKPKLHMYTHPKAYSHDAKIFSYRRKVSFEIVAPNASLTVRDGNNDIILRRNTAEVSVNGVERSANTAGHIQLIAFTWSLHGLQKHLLRIHIGEFSFSDHNFWLDRVFGGPMAPEGSGRGREQGEKGCCV